MASLSIISNPVITRFRDAVAEIYGDRLERVVLFGSRARGDAQDDSDYDVAVFLRDLEDLRTTWTYWPTYRPMSCMTLVPWCTLCRIEQAPTTTARR